MALLRISLYAFAHSVSNGRPSSRSGAGRRSLKAAYTDGARARVLRLGAVLARRGVTANMITLTGLLVHFFALPLILTGRFLGAACIFALAAICDLLDGAVAHAGAGATVAGAFLDSTTDRISELLVFGTLAIFFARAGRWPEMVATLVFLGAAQIVSYVRARAEALGTECKVGFMSRPERVVGLGLGFIFSSYAIAGVNVLTFMVFLLATLTTLTAVHRIVYVMRRLRRIQT